MASILIMGLGRVGSSDDAQRPELPRSHVGAALRAGLQIVGLVDLNPQALDAARLQWPEIDAGVFFDAVEAYTGPRPDVVVVASATANRPRDVAQAIALSPRLVLIEKPLAASLAEGEEVITALSRANIPGYVNYMRRFSPHLQAALRAMEGRPKLAVFRYQGGVLNMASHVVDLLVGRYGQPRAAEAIGVPQGGSEADRGISFRLAFDGFDAFFLALPQVGYGQLDGDVFYDCGRLEIGSNGVSVRVHRPQAGALFPGYVHLVGQEPVLSWEMGMAEIHRQLRDHVDAGAPFPACPLHDGLGILAAAEAVWQSFALGGLPVPMPSLNSPDQVPQ